MFTSSEHFKRSEQCSPAGALQCRSWRASKRSSAAVIKTSNTLNVMNLPHDGYVRHGVLDPGVGCQYQTSMFEQGPQVTRDRQMLLPAGHMV